MQDAILVVAHRQAAAILVRHLEVDDTKEHEELGVATSLLDPVVTTEPKKNRTLRVELSDPTVRRAGLLEDFSVFPGKTDFPT